jgi:hypothetical protein
MILIENNLLNQSAIPYPYFDKVNGNIQIKMTDLITVSEIFSKP